MCLCETWLDDIFVDNVFLNPDYVTATRVDRKTGENGGVLILCKHTVKFQALKTSCDFACAVKLHSNKSLLIIICVYYPPRGSQYRVGWTTFRATIHQLIPTHDFKIIITGDFNEPNVDWNSFTTTNADFEVVLGFMIQYSIYQLIISPTHSACTIPDVVITSSAEVFLPQKSHIPMAFSEHHAIHSCVDLSSISYSTTATLSAPARIPFSSFNRLNFALCSNFFSVSISFHEHYVKKYIACFGEILRQFLERKRQKRFEFPWYYSSHTVHLHNKVKTASNFFRLHSLQSLHEDLCISIELDTACFVTEFSEKHKSLFACYKLINKLQSTPVPIEMTYNDDILCGPQNIADAFNKFFITVYNPPIETLVD